MTLGLVAAYQREIKDGREYDHLFPVPDFKDSHLMEGDVKDTARLMGEYIRKYQGDTKKLAPLLKGRTLAETLENDWDFVYHHVQYNLDKQGEEQLRRPARTWAERQRGVDCDCYTIFLCTLLLNQGISPVIRIVRIPPQPGFHHVYPIVTTRQGYYALDCVLDKFNTEKDFGSSKNKIDYTMNSLGIPIIGLHGFEDTNPLFSLMSTTNGLGADTDEVILQKLITTRDLAKANPESISWYDKPEKFIEELDYAIRYWDDPDKRKQALAILAAREAAQEPMNGLAGDDPDVLIIENALRGDDGFDGVLTGDDFGRVMIAKDKRMQARKRTLRPPATGRGNARKVYDIRKKLIETGESRIKELQKLDETGRQKAARILTETYQEPVEEYEISEDPKDELIEEYIDDVEEIEDTLDMFDSYETGIGAFWNKKKKRLEKKEKRIEKRKEKAVKKGKDKAVKRLDEKLEKNKMKQEGTWKEERKDWRKENKRGFWNGVQKLGQGAIDAVVKFNPVSIAARNGFLLAVKTNAFKMKDNLKWGYATKEQAKAKGVSEDKWNKSVKALDQVTNLFVKTFKGEKKALRNAVLSGKKGSIEGLGVVETGLMAAAAPIITAVLAILKKVGLLKKDVNAEEVIDAIQKGTNLGIEEDDEMSTEFEEKESTDESGGGFSFGNSKWLLWGAGILAAVGVGYFILRKKGNKDKAPKSTAKGELSGCQSIGKIKKVTLT